MASLAELGAGAGAALERGSSWYWSNFDAASNRVAAVASRFAVREVDEHSQQQDGAPDSTATPLSRREFLRRIRPMR